MGAEKEKKVKDKGKRQTYGKITVQIVNARNLKNKELLSKSDPYCKVRVL